jgi:hypothetical protein
MKLDNPFRVCYVDDRSHAYNTIASVVSAARVIGGDWSLDILPDGADKLKCIFFQLGMKLHGAITSSYAIYCVP